MTNPASCAAAHFARFAVQGPPARRLAQRVRIARSMILALSLLLFPAIATAAEGGAGKFIIKRTGAPALTVWTYVPTELTVATKVVFVMHGVQRNGEEYRDQWVKIAADRGFLLLVPEFSEKAYPGGDGYNLGAIGTGDGAMKPRDEWSYSRIEEVFDDARARYGLQAETYSLYGHSAGAQFAHRFALYGAGPRARRVVSANAGWYQMPDWRYAFPYGLDQAGLTEDDEKRFLEAPLTVLLGDADIDPQSPSLRHSPEAEAQGANRFERGQAFFARGEAEAKRLGVAFGWTLAIAPGVAHDNAQMAPFAVESLISD